MNKTICIIDDDEDVRAVMCFALEFEGMTVLPLENGKKAIDYLRTLSPENYPCLIIVDYMMPEMDGLEFIKTVRTQYTQTLASIPIALSSARDSIGSSPGLPSDIITLAKPIELQDLLNLAKAHWGDEEMLMSSAL